MLSLFASYRFVLLASHHNPTSTEGTATLTVDAIAEDTPSPPSTSEHAPQQPETEPEPETVAITEAQSQQPTEGATTQAAETKVCWCGGV